MDLQWIGELAVIDRSQHDEEDVWYSFAVDELLSEQAVRQQQVICHLWCHQSAIILGQRDARLPYVREAIAVLEQKDYETCVRHSGGAAVPLDKNVLNISLIFPVGRISESSYNEGFAKMYELIQAVCSQMPYTIEKGEVKGAYCPGDYDLSVNGLKFCGIAQRRKVKAYIVQAFINIDGDSVKRAQLIKQFYELAVKERSDADYPSINPQTLASLSQFASFLATQRDETSKADTEVVAFIKQLNSTIDEIAYKTKIKRSQFDMDFYPSDEQIKEQAKQLKKRYSLQ